MTTIKMESISYQSKLFTSERILTVLQYATPPVVLIVYLIAFTIRSIIASKGEVKPAKEVTEQYGPGGKPLPKKLNRVRDKNDTINLDFSRPRKLLFFWLSLAVAATYLANAANVITHALIYREEGWWCGKSATVYIGASFWVYTYLVLSLLDSTPSPTTAHLATWTVNAVLEIMVIIASLGVYNKRHHENYILDSSYARFRDRMTEWEFAEIMTDFVRLFILLALVSFYLIFVISRNARIRKARAGEVTNEETVGESTGLLTEPQAEDGLVRQSPRPANGSIKRAPASSSGPNGHANGYGTNASAGAAQPKAADSAPPGWERPATTPTRSWIEYLKGYALFFPYLWPSKDRRLQVVVVICVIIMILQRGINVLVPYQAGVITNILSGEDDVAPRMPWAEICLYIFYRILQGNNGVFGATRAILWIPVGQYSYRELSVAAFEHVHSLSLDFHLGKKTGEVLSALGKGSAINSFLENITFQVVPMLVDLLVAMAYFLIAFDVYFAVIVAIVTFWYIFITIRMAQWRADIRRDMVNADREEDAVKNDSMVSYETVKYFNAEAYEFNRYRQAVVKYQEAEYKVTTSLSYMNVSQNLIFMSGLLIACFVAGYQVASGQRKVGDFVSLLTYMAQLQGPLNFFGTFYRMIQSSMINSERMLELFKEKATVVDQHDVKNFERCEGDIIFENIKFAYDERKPALQDLSFRALPGTTTALVGESGGGKSTVFRLLFRFYNAESGRIMVDGNDVTDISIDSLRRHIGVVPQDTVLFNETLLYNLKYARQEATEEEIHAACRAASIHDRIMSFPDGYNTKVGERGLRLSGGEKQRVAIARTILKNPRVILLDEATAALDTETEQHIQDALLTLGKGRTMLVIAHRLSTITTADQILVMHDGRVDERGTHDELLARKGRYASMWRKQVRAQKAAEEAKVLKDKADRLRKEIREGDHDGLTSASEDEREDKRNGTGSGKSFGAVLGEASSSKKPAGHP